MNILFRADSSSIIGTGHIMRDLVLAKQYNDNNIIFATQNLDGNINHKIVDSNYKLEILASNNIEELMDVIKKYSIDMIVIDHYEIDYSFEKDLKEKTGIKIFVLDDTYEKHYCDILLNHNISANKEKYKELVPAFCELRCGSKYTLLREEFLKTKKEKYKYAKKYNKVLKTVFVAMGGADHSNINIKILEVLKYFKNINVNLVTTSANKNLKMLLKYSKNKSWINVYINSYKIAKLMAKSDFCIISPSVTANEVYFMKIPFIVIQTATNQSNMASFLRKNRYCVLSKMNSIKLKNALYKMIKKV